jgi:hypothetical protein
MVWTAAVRIPAEGRNFLYSTKSGLAMWSNQPIKWVPTALIRGVRRPEREAYHLLPPSIKGDGAVPPVPPMSSWPDAWLIKHRDNSGIFLPFKLMYR